MSEQAEQVEVKLPRGTEVLEVEVEEGIDVDLAVDFARKGASLSLVRAIGGEPAVELVKEQHEAAGEQGQAAEDSQVVRRHDGA